MFAKSMDFPCKPLRSLVPPEPYFAQLESIILFLLEVLTSSEQLKISLTFTWILTLTITMALSLTLLLYLALIFSLEFESSSFSLLRIYVILVYLFIWCYLSIFFYILPDKLFSWLPQNKTFFKHVHNWALKNMLNDFSS